VSALTPLSKVPSKGFAASATPTHPDGVGKGPELTYQVAAVIVWSPAALRRDISDGGQTPSLAWVDTVHFTDDWVGVCDARQVGGKNRLLGQGPFGLTKRGEWRPDSLRLDFGRLVPAVS
jgi:hypothetical protein